MGDLRWIFGLIITTSLHVIEIHTIPSAPDILGRYCNAVDGPICCNGRQDSCSLPILGTLCYCDAFCDTRPDDDCCPDYGFACNNEPETPEHFWRGCDYKGQILEPGEKVMENCNSCTCTFTVNKTELLCGKRHECLTDLRIVETVNLDRSYGWTSSNYSFFWGKTLDEGIKYKLGTLQPERFVIKMNPIRRIYDPASLATEFDSETEWPAYVTGIQDQGWCGASWAISTAAVASDRYAIISKGRERVKLSAQHLLSCNSRGQQRCDGGHLDRAWQYFRNAGLVDENCFPYTGKTEACNKHQLDRCPPGPLRKTNRYRVAPVYRLGNETDIMYEIIKSGPVQATMKVYHDFYTYQSGIYQHTDLSVIDRTGYHSVRIVGWGEERGVKFWKVANSWGRHWGENGFFRIVRGKNECDIESFVLAAWPDFDEW